MSPEEWRVRIERLLDEIRRESDESRSARATVELDQQSVGRLSRQDALQQQAMAKAQEQRRSRQNRRLAAALERITAGEFGYCLECGEAIADRRLELDLAAELCVSCAR